MRGARELRSRAEQDLRDMIELQATGRFLEWRMPPLLYGVAMMLGGFALENLAKALIVAQRPELVQQGGQLGRPLGTHDLERLLGEAAVSLTDDERRTVVRAAQFVLWAGRYPTPKHAVAMRPTRDERGDLVETGRVTSIELDTIDELYERLRSPAFVDMRRFEKARTRARETEKVAETPMILDRLRHLRRVDEDGVAVYYDNSIADEGDVRRWHTVCVACGKQFVLSPARPGAICRCPRLYYGVDRFDPAADRMMFSTEQYKLPTDWDG
jgi:hypothetical protein